MTHLLRSTELSLFFLTVNIFLVPILISATTYAASVKQADMHQRIEQVLLDANTLRTTYATEHQTWADNKAKMEVLLSSINALAERAETMAKADAKKAEELTKSVSRLQQSQQSGAAIEQLCRDMMKEIHVYLDNLEKQSLGGTVPGKNANYGDIREQWQQAMSRWKGTEDAIKTLKVETRVGLLDGAATKVKALVIGVNFGWWLSDLDARGGLILPDPTGNGATVLAEFSGRPLQRTTMVAELEKAFSIIEGRKSPHWVSLPVLPQAPVAVEAP